MGDINSSYQIKTYFTGYLLEHALNSIIFTFAFLSFCYGFIAQGIRLTSVWKNISKYMAKYLQKIN